MQIWEYKILVAEYPFNVMSLYIRYVDEKEIPDWKERKWSIHQALNELGKKGWELIQVDNNHAYILKRAIDRRYEIEKPAKGP